MEQTTSDTYYTLGGEAEALYKEKGSKFLTYAYPVRSEAEIKEHLDALRKRYYDATHHCYAWRLGPKGESFRANDDGEPSSTAGRPILGQLLSKEVTYARIGVVRYFGGTKLGVPGLIEAYKTSAALVLENAVIEQRTVDIGTKIRFSYLAMNDVMRIVKEMQPQIIDQQFDNLCTMTLSIRQSRAEQLLERLSKVEGLEIDTDDQ